MPNHRCDDQTTLVVFHCLVKQCTFQSFATKDTTKCACKHYLPSEYTWAFSALGVSNKEFYKITHQTLDYLTFGAWQHGHLVF
jgi:hypothetical protein